MLFKRSLIFFLVLLPVLVFADDSIQSARPKIGLVLSGGGAKGFAHIGVLKTLEANGIRPDYITGTSMGSVVGALYAIGYSASEIEDIIGSIDWGSILSISESMSEIGVFEKQNYSKYIAEMSFSDKKIRLPGGMVEGNLLKLELSKFFFPANQYHSFDEFPIPFRAVAVDIETGELKVFDSGYLPSILRASISVPSLLTPEVIDGSSYLDGGLIRNFPVQEVIDMGAEFVIGSYTGGKFLDEARDHDITDIVETISFFGGVRDAVHQKTMCNLIIEHDLSPYKGSDFNFYEELIEIGEEESRRVILQADDLLSLTNSSLQKHSVAGPKDSIFIETIDLQSVPKYYHTFVLGVLGKSSNEWIHESDIYAACQLINGTLDFYYFNYEITKTGLYTYTLSFKCKVRPDYSFRTGFNYHSNAPLSVFLDGTVRNFVGTRAHLYTHLRLSEDDLERIVYERYGGAFKRWLLELGGMHEGFYASVYHRDLITYRFRVNHYEAFFKNSYQLSQNKAIGIQSNIKRYTMKAQTIESSIRNVNTRVVGAGVLFRWNSLNKQYFPTRGHKMTIDAQMLLWQREEVDYTSGISPTEKTDPFDVFGHVKYMNRVPIVPSLVLCSELSAGYVSNKEGYQYFAIGGNMALRMLDVSFPGLEYGQIPYDAYAKGSLSLQLSLSNKLYVIPNYSLLMGDLHLYNVINEDLDIPSVLYGSCITVGYLSVAGPVMIAMHYSNYAKVVELFFNVGYIYQF